MNTLSELYLGSEPVSVKVHESQLVIGLENGQTLHLPLQIVSQFAVNDFLSEDAEILALRHPPKIDHIHVTDSALHVFLEDGRTLSCPLSWFPRLVHGTPVERNHYELVGADDAIHWPDLDEDIELTRLFEGGKSAESESSIQRWLASRQEKIAVH